MYFHREKGKQTLDLKGNLILSKNVNLITSRVKSAAPTHVENAKYVVLNDHGFWCRVKAMFMVFGFIWSK